MYFKYMLIVKRLYDYIYYKCNQSQGKETCVKFKEVTPMVTFRLSDFERKLLDIKLSKNWDRIVDETTDKFHLGVEYAVTFDPGFEFPKSMLDSQKFFFVDDNDNIIKANDANLFENAISYADDVRCDIVYKIVHKTNCTVVIFKFMPVHSFNTVYPYTSIFRTVFEYCFLYKEKDPEKIMARVSLCEDDPDIRAGISNKWIITNDPLEISAIYCDIIDDSDDVADEDLDDEDVLDDDADDEDVLDDEDPENSDEPDDDSAK